MDAGDVASTVMFESLGRRPAVGSHARRVMPSTASQESAADAQAVPYRSNETIGTVRRPPWSLLAPQAIPLMRPPLRKILQ
jgi:hypothetical protein